MFYCGDQVKENEMGGACCIHGRGNICAQDFACKQWGENGGGEINNKIKIYLKETGRKVVACVLRDQDRNQCQKLLKTVMKFRFL